MSFRHWFIVAGMVLLGFAVPASADHHQGGHASAADGAPSGTKVNAEIRRIDADNGKVTLKHEALTEFDMGAMTMVFRVEDPALLKSFSVGQRVRFVLARKNGQLIVVAMEKAD